MPGRSPTVTSPDTSLLGDATSPVAVRYGVLGVTMAQTLSPAEPILVMPPYCACK